ncbi:MAG: hypothetical protein ABSE15_00920 [Candidatus Bathyarchaeia archaeon]|jgi:hypothetical protein
MGSIERADIYLLRNYRKVVLFLIVVVFLLSIVLPFLPFSYYKGNLQSDVNPTIINGILTVTAIVFGFVAFELRDLKSSVFGKFLLSLPLLFFLIVTLEFIFIGATTGKMTELFALETTANCLFNILYVLPIMILKQAHVDIEQGKIKEESKKVNDKGDTMPSHDEIRFSILTILYEKAELTPKDPMIDREKFTEVLNVPDNKIDFDLIYLEQEKLIARANLYRGSSYKSSKITSAGINVIEHKEENKNRFPFLTATIPIQIQNKIGLINL